MMEPLHEKARIMDAKAVDRAIQRIGYEIVEHNRGTENVVLIGIQRRGVPLARSIAEHIKAIEGGKVPTGTLDVTFYRDDLTFLKEREGGEREKAETDIPFSVTGRDVILVDDVLFTGRTVRAAMDLCANPSANTNSILKTFNNPFTSRNSFDHFIGQATDCFAQPVNDSIERIEHLISKSHRAELLPDLFDGIHFGRIRRNRKQSYICRTNQ